MCCKYKGLMKEILEILTELKHCESFEHGFRKSDVGHVWNFNIRIHIIQKKENSV